MKILVLNSGSSSVKYRLFEMIDETCLAWGLVERIGSAGAILNHYRHDGHSVKLSAGVNNHAQAIKHILSILLSPNHGVLKKREEIEVLGHRVVHGGENFTESVMINDEVMKQLHDCIELAPLHNPHNIRGIDACMKVFSDRPHIAVFDTSFHQNMPAKAYLYGLPYDIYKRYGIRRFGFHGISHRYVSERAAKLIGKPLSELNLITLHLGNGCSIAAIKGGISVDTSMGFTPAEGLLMGTRVGDMDSAALLYVMSHENLDASEANSLINKRSGLLGISGISNDMREIEEAAKSGNKRAQMAIELFTYRAKKYIGAYAAVLGRVDGVVFTGGIGENRSEVRRNTIEGLKLFKLAINDDKNDINDDNEKFINMDGMTKIMVIPTNEELVIARDTFEIIGRHL